jgi:hypothetical protein
MAGSPASRGGWHALTSAAGFAAARFVGTSQLWLVP